jgi:hypothetical protein
MKEKSIKKLFSTLTVEDFQKRPIWSFDGEKTDTGDWMMEAVTKFPVHSLNLAEFLGMDVVTFFRSR